ncbi:MAG: Iron-regulated transporter permease protein SufD [Chitinophagaceae bacterium]|nr:Iron-regulated transporter permease protein SufD [Chitinophagaceae bacterium]
MNTIEYFKERFERLQLTDKDSGLGTIRQHGFNAFSKFGIPTSKHEEWKYTRIGGLFNKEYQFPVNSILTSITAEEIDAIRLPGYEEANELVFVNGIFSLPLSSIRSRDLIVLPLEEAAKNEYAAIVSKHLGHSSNYLKDGINALNTAFVQGGVFIHVKKGKVPEHPVYIYNITDARSVNVFAQPRSLVHIAENAQVQLIETYSTIGQSESFTNQVMEIVVEKDALLEYYKIQNDVVASNQVSTTHIRQTGKSYIHTVTISLNGGIIRNNLNVVLEAEYCEAHLYGLYFQRGQTHIDNHTVVDNVTPHSFSNELYKGILNDRATAVFNGKIFVRPQAQKTNAYQSNKNILLSADASVNTKPQLEIFADDVKCSHGCTIGRLDEEGLFYLRSRGVNEKIARSLLVHAYAIDILEHIKPLPIRDYINQLISERLEFDIA